MKTFFQKKKKLKEALSTHAGARRLFVQGMLLKRRARTGNGERGTWNGKTIEITISYYWNTDNEKGLAYYLKLETL